MTPERQWWLRTLAVLVGPRPVFAALRSDDRDDVEARQEPVLAIVWLAGTAWLLADPVSGRIFDDPGFDWLVALVWAFVGGGAVGLVGYFVLGGALALGLRGLGSPGSFQRARHLLAFAAVPFVLSIPVFAAKLGVYGSDALRTGGADDGAGGTAFTVVQLAFAAWTAVLLLVGVRAVERWTWLRSLGALGLLAIFAAAAAVVASGIF